MKKKYNEESLLAKAGCWILALGFTIAIMFGIVFPLIIWILIGTFPAERYFTSLFPLGSIIFRLSVVGLASIIIGLVFDF